MPIYEGDWPGPAEWNIAATLELQDDGRFEYGEHWTCYLAATGAHAKGRWSRRGDALVLQPDESDEAPYLTMKAGTEIVGNMTADHVDFGFGFVLKLKVEREEVVSPPRTNAEAPTRSTSISDRPLVRENTPPMRAVARPVGALRVESAAGSPATTRPSSALSARIQKLIDEVPLPEFGLSLQPLCREWNVLPLHANEIYLWGLRPDGMLLCIDHESFRQEGEPETDPVAVYTALRHGAERYPELAELIPPAPG